METGNKHIEDRTLFERGQEDARNWIEYMEGVASVIGAALNAAATDESFNAPDEPPPTVEAGKTRLSDCRACWCNSCANIEQCDIINVENSEPDGICPNPCIGCLDGMRSMPVDKEQACKNYIEAEGWNYG